MINSPTDTRRPDEIESDIARKRAEVSSTIDAIQRKLTPGELMEEAMQMLRQGNAREFTDNLGRSVRDNPMPVVLIGVGLAWMMLGANRRRPLPEWRHELEYHAPSTDPMASTPGAGAMSYDASGSMRSGTGMGLDGDDASFGARADLGTAPGAASDAQPGLRGRMADATSSVRSTITGAAHGARESVSGVAQRARSLGHDVRVRAGDLGGRARMQASQAQQTLGHWVDEQPLLVGALGLAAGALLGAVLPATRREDTLIGSVSDEWMDTARDSARESLQTVRSSAERVAQTARDEVERVIDRVGSQSGSTGTPTS